jgi:N-acetylglucosamine-6-phosphate deacetylase
LENAQIINARFFAQGQFLPIKSITINQDRIAAIDAPATGQSIDLKGKILMPGLFDTHINGGEKYYFTKEVSIEALADMEAATAATGTAYFLPCLITSSLSNILKGLAIAKTYMAFHPNTGMLGIHLEGPFLNPIKRGAHMARYIQKPTVEALEQILVAGQGVIKLMTIAPEVFDEPCLNYLINSGIKLSMGHSNASFAEAKAAAKRGIGLCTHLFNAMSPLGHREPGLVGAVLHTADMYAPIIADNTHVSNAAVELAYKLKPDKLFLISDALFVNRKVKLFEWEVFDARLENNTYINSDGNLAGATYSLAECVLNAVENCHIPLTVALEMASSRPFEALGMAAPTLAIGQKARFTTITGT